VVQLNGALNTERQAKDIFTMGNMMGLQFSMLCLLLSCNHIATEGGSLTGLRAMLCCFMQAHVKKQILKFWSLLRNSPLCMTVKSLFPSMNKITQYTGSLNNYKTALSLQHIAPLKM
jgi:hypothetical protein